MLLFFLKENFIHSFIFIFWKHKKIYEGWNLKGTSLLVVVMSVEDSSTTPSLMVSPTDSVARNSVEFDISEKFRQRLDETHAKKDLTQVCFHINMQYTDFCSRSSSTYRAMPILFLFVQFCFNFILCFFFFLNVLSKLPVDNSPWWSVDKWMIT